MGEREDERTGSANSGGNSNSSGCVRGCGARGPGCGATAGAMGAAAAAAAEAMTGRDARRSAIRDNWLTARLIANVTNPPAATTVPARINVLPRLNSLIGMPKPIRIAPSAIARMPTTIKTNDIPQSSSPAAILNEL
jgi:hypothetical protein